jgi:dihydroorotate dehydrogenase electron transfer subunit
MGKRVEDLKILENRRLSQEFFILEFSVDDKINDFKPGQFVQVKVDGSPETFLRRPISIYDVDFEKNTFRLFIQVVGKGTSVLSQMKAGDSLNLIYPLGTSFTVPEQGEKVLLVGGGVGIAPLFFLGKCMNSKGYKPDILLGFRNRDRIFEVDEFMKVGSVFLTTEDGSEGEKGFVTDHPILKSTEYDKIFCCGPEPMMKAVASYCRKNSIFCEVSLENLMACGFGVCLCCIADTVRGNLCSCIDGPVFNLNDLKW